MSIVMPRGWKAVEMTEHIAALPRDKKGFPIPYVAEWSREGDSSEMDIRENYAVATCNCVVGVGEPVLGNQCPVRQRECMKEHKCQVCGFTIEGFPNTEMAFLGHENLNVFWEPPLHLSCAAYSLQVCPGITRRPGMSVRVCKEYTLLDRFEFSPDPNDIEFVEHGDVPMMVSFGIRRAILVYHGAIPEDAQIMSADEFLEYHNG
jgi:hypothetical protein